MKADFLSGNAVLKKCSFFLVIGQPPGVGMFVSVGVREFGSSRFQSRATIKVYAGRRAVSKRGLGASGEGCDAFPSANPGSIPILNTEKQRHRGVWARTTDSIHKPYRDT